VVLRGRAHRFQAPGSSRLRSSRCRLGPCSLQTTSDRSWHWAPASASRLLQWGQGLASAADGAITAPHTLQYPAVLWLPE
jgi:hypothetical protein